MSRPTIKEAEEGDLISLSTIIPRAFHPINALFRKLFPDTALMRDWWYEIFRHARADSASHLLIVTDEDAKDVSKRVVGMIFLQLCGGPDDKAVEFWAEHPLTSDHDAHLFDVVSAPIHEPRARLLQGRKHHLVHSLAVDHAYQGKGIGTALLQRACGIADQDGHDIFVEANMGAAPVYIKNGFELLEEIVLPVEMPYSEGLLLRPYKLPKA